MKKRTATYAAASLPHAGFVRRVNGIQITDVSQEDLPALLKNASLEQRYALLKAVIRQVTGLTLFDTQLSTAYSLQLGRVAELPTGEGKTLAAAVAAACYALDGHRVHVLVFNDYLAKRDSLANAHIYAQCGLKTAYIDQNTPPEERRAAYASPICYVSAKEAGFDYLRGFLAMEAKDGLFPDFDVAIVDEADSIFIDEGKTPLVLAGEAPRQDDRIFEIDACVRNLTGSDVDIDRVERQAWLTETGMDHMESMLQASIFNEENIALLSCVQNAMEAHYLLQKDKDYIVKNAAVQIVESTTGRVVQNKRYPDLLHRAVEAKEGIPPAPQTVCYNTITMQNFLLQYPVLCGMTGTIATSIAEMRRSYGLEVDIIAAHNPCIRNDYPDRVFFFSSEHRAAMLEQIQKVRPKEQPVLVGTQNVAESEEISWSLREIGVEHVILNAKNDEAEAAVISQAGEPGKVTISTNMAGRGVDIKLGGFDERQREAVVAAGGLLVLSSGINTCVRIDNQLRGRAGRQGDPGESRFYICLEDTALLSRMSAFQRVLAENGKSSLRHSVVRRIQKQMDAEAAEARYMLKRYASVLEQQRCLISEWREDILKDRQYMAYLETQNPPAYQTLCEQAGQNGVRRAERQLILYYSIQFWASHLANMDEIRESIHFMVVAKKDPLVEYYRCAIDSYEQMMSGIQSAVLNAVTTVPVTKNGIDMEEAGLSGGTTTWTYAIDDSSNQFNAMRMIAGNIRGTFTGADGIFTKLLKRWRHMR